MAIFKLFCCRENKDEAEYTYDSSNNTIYNINGIELVIPNIKVGIENTLGSLSSVNSSRLKDENNNTVFKIQLGLECNYKCSYCFQNINEGKNKEFPLPISQFLSLIPNSTSQNRTFEFWGGEPLLYWEDLKPLGEAIREKFPTANIYMPTNGSLLDYEKNEWLDRMGFGVSVSHDGPGQWQRGGDCLGEPQQREVIQNLFNLLNKKGNFSFNPMLTKYNSSRKTINDWFLQEIGHDFFCLGEGGFIHPAVEDHLDMCLQTIEEMIVYSSASLVELRKNAAKNITLIPYRLNRILGAFYSHESQSNLSRMCGCDREDVISADLFGNIITCQNVSASDFSSEGASHKIGSLFNVKEAYLDLDTISPLLNNDLCVNCPVLFLCKGSCALSPPGVWKVACNNNFADYFPFFAVAFEMVTGFLPYYIEGPLPEERKDIFGAIARGDKSFLFENPIE